MSVSKLVSPEDAGAMLEEFQRQIDENLERQGYKRNLEKVDSRDLTDEELKVLHQCYKDGLEAMKAHPWAVKYEDNRPYWKQKIRKV